MVVVSPHGAAGFEPGRGFARDFSFVDETEDSPEGRALFEGVVHRHGGCRTLVPVRAAVVDSRVELWVERRCARARHCVVLSDLPGFTRVRAAPLALAPAPDLRARALAESARTSADCEPASRVDCAPPCAWFGVKYGCRDAAFHDFRTRSECLARRAFVWDGARCVRG